MDDSTLTRIVCRWLETVVIGLELCPFAARPLQEDRVRFTVCHATTDDGLLAALQAELELMENDPGIETTLLIHPEVLQDFDAYNQFLDVTDALLEALDLKGVYQIASFHPEYRFAGTAADDAENYSNRSPVPLLQILREASVEAVVNDYPDIEGIPDRNIATLQRLGIEHMKAELERCSKHDE